VTCGIAPGEEFLQTVLMLEFAGGLDLEVF
jgi:hypothetical protein